MAGVGQLMISAAEKEYFTAFPQQAQLASESIRAAHVFAEQDPAIAKEKEPQFSSYWNGAALNLYGNARLHRDKADGLYCCIMVAGDFNAAAGEGALALWELQQRIYLYPGDAVFFPSWLINHSVDPYSEGSERFSFVLFTDNTLLKKKKKKKKGEATNKFV